MPSPSDQEAPTLVEDRAETASMSSQDGRGSVDSVTSVSSAPTNITTPDLSDTEKPVATAVLPSPSRRVKLASPKTPERVKEVAPVQDSRRSPGKAATESNTKSPASEGAPAGPKTTPKPAEKVAAAASGLPAAETPVVEGSSSRKRAPSTDKLPVVKIVPAKVESPKPKATKASLKLTRKRKAEEDQDESDEEAGKDAAAAKSPGKKPYGLRSPVANCYYVTRAEEMLNDPLDFDDLVYDETRPGKAKQIFNTFLHFRYAQGQPIPTVMSGGCGPAGTPPGPCKPPTPKKRRSTPGSDSDSLKKGVLSREHEKKVEQDQLQAAETPNGKKKPSSSSPARAKAKVLNEDDLLVPGYITGRTTDRTNSQGGILVGDINDAIKTGPRTAKKFGGRGRRGRGTWRGA
ncbi:hypothetical protein QBC47DRAFT_361212 [Echria macrotheca]|uniref:Uncharacterized protein n=1 Tax=Echria macrotheca TaxID=438768 RepID=A0AAJ0BBE4_9PEZI|nr:hypothetical protein QBC47DRAFT_361212 [Echria macrotheca]